MAIPSASFGRDAPADPAWAQGTQTRWFTPRQQMQAGLLAMLVVWLPCAAGLWSLRNLALSEPVFDLLFLLLMLESRPLRELAHATRSLATQETLPLARLQSAPWLKRETGQTLGHGARQSGDGELLPCVWSANGLARLMGYALAGVQGALLWRLVQLMNQSWSIAKNPPLTTLVAPPVSSIRGSMLPPSCCWGCRSCSRGSSRPHSCCAMVRSGPIPPSGCC